jgi:hypothetical protein
VARIVSAFRVVIAQLLRSPFDFVKRIPVDGVEHDAPELIHAIFAVATVQAKLGEEHIVSVVATYLAQIIRDNPDFVSWLQATVRR